MISDDSLSLLIMNFTSVNLVNMKQQIIYGNISYGGTDYQVEVIFKKTRIMKIRLKNNIFYVTCPIFLKKNKFEELKEVLNFINKCAPKLLQKVSKNLPSGENFIYLFGDKIDINYPGLIKFSNNYEISFNNKEELERKLIRFFKSIMEERTLYFEKLMKITTPYKVSVRKMETRYGSNSKLTHKICYNLFLIHFSIEIIDSVIVHELAHEFFHYHDNKFYSLVKKYYPNYDLCHQKLRKRIYK